MAGFAADELERSVLAQHISKNTVEGMIGLVRTASLITCNEQFSFSNRFWFDMRHIAMFRNVGDRDVSVTVEAYYTLDDEVEESVLRTISVAGGGVVHVGLTQEMQSLPVGVNNIGLRFEYNATGGGLLADLLLVDNAGSQVFQLFPKGYEAHPHSMHNFPFRIDSNLETIVTVANPSDTEEADYAFVLFYDDATYTALDTKLAPGQVEHISVKAFRDQQIAGLNGVRVPPTVTAGHVKVLYRGVPSDTQGPVQAEHAASHGGTVPPSLLAGATIIDTANYVSFTTCYGQSQPIVPLGIYLNPSGDEGPLDSLSETEVTAIAYLR